MFDGSRETTIAEGTEFQGSVRSEAHINLSGVLKGQVDAPGLTVTSTGRLDGKVRVGELRSDGEIAGEIEAETAELGGRIGDRTVIRAKKLEIRLQDEGGVDVSFGDCDLEVGSRPERTSSRLPDEQGQAEIQTPAEAGVTSFSGSVIRRM